MKDGRMRRGVKRAARGLYDARLRIHRRTADIRYELGGECIRCAACCERPGIQVSKLTWYFPFALRVFLWWHRYINGFELVEARRADLAVIFDCTHFDQVSRECDSYSSRPGMCRDYPRPFLEQANPEFFEGCGYKAVSTKRDALLQILDTQGIGQDQMDKLKKGLYLED